MKTLFVGAVALLSIVTIAHSQIKTAGLRSDDWMTRAAALRKIMAIPNVLNDPSVRTALIDTMEREDDILEGKVTVQPSPFDDETYGDNYISMLEKAVFSIAQNTNDQRAYDALVPSAYDPETL